MEPIILTPNQPRQFYRGGRRIAEFRGVAGADEFRPEDWLASTTHVFGRPDGLSMLPDGRTLRDAVEADPAGFLGPSHNATFGTDTALLVKLLDAGQRLPVHAHPDRQFAAKHLGCAYGKTEAWIVLDAPSDAVVYLGLREGADAQAFRRSLKTQDSESMLAAMRRVQVGTGDSVLVPAGTPHVIGEGIFVVELQEPTDFSVMLEWQPFGLSDCSVEQLGLPTDTALSCVDLSAWDDERLASCVTRAEAHAAGTHRLLPAQANPYFRAEQIIVPPAARLGPQFAILIVTRGTGELKTTEHTTELRRGDTVLVPYSAGETTVVGDVSLVRCMPPTS